MWSMNIFSMYLINSRFSETCLMAQYIVYFDKCSMCTWKQCVCCSFAIMYRVHGTTDWYQIGKGVHQGYILSPCLFNLYAEYIMRNAGLEEAQAGIKIAGRDLNNLKYEDDTTVMAENEELKSLLMKVKEESEKLA